MMKNTAAVLLLLALLLAISLLASCQTGDGGMADTDNKSGENAAEGTDDSAGPTGAQNEQAKNELKSGLAGFESLDLDGNAVTGDIFAENKLTMVNVWGTRCPYCIEEMPALAKLNSDYADSGFAVLGIISNVVSYDGEKVEEMNADDARYIIEETGVNFTNVVLTENLYNLLPDISALPTTFFVDENGVMVGKTYLGAKSYDQWASIIESLLEEVG
jgi:thiol-disulfide isomerase/thioredoxin